jgi:hypothetical protein
MASKNFMLQFISHCVVLAYFYTFTALLEQFIGIYGFTSQQASYLIAGFQFCGMAGGVLTTILLTRYGCEYFKTASLIIISSTFFSNDSTSNLV